ncbi:hypothetical protein B5807_03117 [Epicoccum nigrum]|uniref:Uncharacterized protein n=1 Tax=Epicoccum nigrum TaxID=105696 RepID=A0A1Y2M8V9_EPING|nr:hypothetical protein B5807_03117 [Epicoccum nigrum]
MPADTSDLDVFVFGTAQMLSQLTDETDDETTTKIIRYALQAVGMSTEKLQLLIFHICTLPTADSTYLAALLVKLSAHVPGTVSSRPTQSGETLKGVELVRHCVINVLRPYLGGFRQLDVWFAKFTEILAELQQTRESSTTDTAIADILEALVTSQHLFTPHNIELFPKTCYYYSPQLDKNGNMDLLAHYINTASEQVPPDSMIYKFMISCLIATRENNWGMVSTASVPSDLSVLTPDEESETEIKLENTAVGSNYGYW